MSQTAYFNSPTGWENLQQATEEVGYDMASDPLTGIFLRTLAASKPAGNVLEMGTGTGLATAWLLDGMDATSRLITIEADPTVAAIAQGHLDHDTRVTFLIEKGEQWLATYADAPFDLIFADAWPGKYSHLDKILSYLTPGGLYIVDDMLPQPKWPEGHDEAAVQALLETLNQRDDLRLTYLEWSTGIVVATKIAT